MFRRRFLGDISPQFEAGRVGRLGIGKIEKLERVPGCRGRAERSLRAGVPGSVAYPVDVLRSGIQVVGDRLVHPDGSDVPRVEQVVGTNHLKYVRLGKINKFRFLGNLHNRFFHIRMRMPCKSARAARISPHRYADIVRNRITGQWRNLEFEHGTVEIPLHRLQLVLFQPVRKVVRFQLPARVRNAELGAVGRHCRVFNGGARFIGDLNRRGPSLDNPVFVPCEPQMVSDLRLDRQAVKPEAGISLILQLDRAGPEGDTMRIGRGRFHLEPDLRKRLMIRQAGRLQTVEINPNRPGFGFDRRPQLGFRQLFACRNLQILRLGRIKAEFDKPFVNSRSLHRPHAERIRIARIHACRAVVFDFRRSGIDRERPFLLRLIAGQIADFQLGRVNSVRQGNGGSIVDLPFRRIQCVLYQFSINIQPDFIRIDQRRPRMNRRIIPVIFAKGLDFRRIRVDRVSIRGGNVLDQRGVQIVVRGTVQCPDLVDIDRARVLIIVFRFHIAHRHGEFQRQRSALRHLRLQIAPAREVDAYGLFDKVDRDIPAVGVEHLCPEPVLLPVSINPHADFFRISRNFDVIVGAFRFDISSGSPDRPREVVLQLRRLVSEADKVLIRFFADAGQCVPVACAWQIPVQSVLEILQNHRREANVNIHGNFYSPIARDNPAALFSLRRRGERSVLVNAPDRTFYPPLEHAVVRLNHLPVPQRRHGQGLLSSRGKRSDRVGKLQFAQFVHDFYLSASREAAGRNGNISHSRRISRRKQSRFIDRPDGCIHTPIWRSRKRGRMGILIDGSRIEPETRTDQHPLQVRLDHEPGCRGFRRFIDKQNAVCGFALRSIGRSVQYFPRRLPGKSGHKRRRTASVKKQRVDNPHVFQHERQILKGYAFAEPRRTPVDFQHNHRAVGLSSDRHPRIQLPVRIGHRYSVLDQQVLSADRHFHIAPRLFKSKTGSDFVVNFQPRQQLSVTAGSGQHHFAFRKRRVPLVLVDGRNAQPHRFPAFHRSVQNFQFNLVTQIVRHGGGIERRCVKDQRLAVEPHPVNMMNRHGIAIDIQRSVQSGASSVNGRSVAFHPKRKPIVGRAGQNLSIPHKQTKRHARRHVIKIRVDCGNNPIAGAIRVIGHLGDSLHAVYFAFRFTRLQLKRGIPRIKLDKMDFFQALRQLHIVPSVMCVRAYFHFALVQNLSKRRRLHFLRPRCPHGEAR